MKLYFDPVSTTCRGILLFAAEHGLALEPAHVSLLAGEHLGAGFLAVNPNGAVPVLEDGDLRLTESSAILRYLAGKTDTAAWPAEARARARVDAMMTWAQTNFYFYYGYLYCYPQLVEYTAYENAGTQADVLRKGLEGSARYLAVLEDHILGDGRPFLCGTTITLADYFMLPILALGELVAFDLTPWPRVLAWKTAMQARPAWAQIDVAFQGWRSAVEAERAQAA